MPNTLEEYLKSEMKDRSYIYFYTGKPPARAKSGQLKIKDTDNELFDKMLTLKEERLYNYGSGNENPRIKCRYVRELE